MNTRPFAASRSIGAVFVAVFYAAAIGLAANPSGWHVLTAPLDPSLSRLSAERLIECLLAETDGGPGTQKPTQLDGFLPLDVPANPFSKDPIPHKSPVMTEIVRRGVGIIPALLDHLSDARATKVILDPKALHLNGASGQYTDAYDYRFHENGPKPPGVNSRSKLGAVEGRWPYTVKVGDLCFVALGQIVNRRLYLAGPDFGNGMWYSGIFVLDVNSPIETPALAVAARADWGGITPEQLTDGLRNDALGLSDPKPGTVDGVWHPGINRDGGIVRLLFYFPDVGSDVVKELLSPPLLHGAVPSSRVGLGQPQIADPDPSRLLAELAPFQWDGLDAKVYALYQSAVAEEKAVVATRPPGERLSSVAYDLPLACAKRLIHRGHDDEFRAFFTASVDRANSEYSAVFEQRKKAIVKQPSTFQGVAPGSPLAASLADADRWQKKFLIQSFSDTLREPILARTEFLQALGPEHP